MVKFLSQHWLVNIIVYSCVGIRKGASSLYIFTPIKNIVISYYSYNTIINTLETFTSTNQPEIETNFIKHCNT